MHQPSLGSLMPRLFLSMVVVIVVMAIIARVLKGRRIPGSGLRFNSTASKRAAVVEMVGRHSLGRNSSINVVRVGDKHLVLGVTEQHISILAELPQIDLNVTTDAHWTGTATDLATTVPENQAWKGLLAQVREYTVRRV